MSAFRGKAALFCEMARYALARRCIGTTGFWLLPSSAAAIRPAMDF